MSEIKKRRLHLPVKCHPGDTVGQYVPFYFCPRSVMLYVIHCANHGGLTYRGGQNPIVHLELDLSGVVAWANGNSRKWAFSLSNAGAAYATFRSSLADLHQLNWSAIGAKDWRDPDIKEGKQAEFLIHDFCPWHLVGQIGVRTMATKVHADKVVAKAGSKTPVRIVPDWYY